MTAAAPPLRSVHLVSDKDGATQAISFRTPLAGAVELTSADLPEEAGALEDLLPKRVPDVLVLSRLTSPRGAALIDWARARAVPVVFHIDDDLLEVPESLGASKASHYRDPRRIAGLRANLDRSDLVYASTGPLAERLREHGVRSPIVAGRIYCSVEPAALRPGWPSGGPVLGYMGTSGHAADLALALPAVERLMEEIPLLQFELFGSIRPPERLQRFGPRVRHLPATPDYAAFLARLRSLGWWAGLAPLEDNPFNRCKASTKWVELSLAGIPVVAQDLPVYRPVCDGGAGRLAASPQDWLAHLRALLSSQARRDAAVAAAQTRLAAEFSHAALREQVLAVLARARAGASTGSGATGSGAAAGRPAGPATIRRALRGALRREAVTLDALANGLPDGFGTAVELLRGLRGRVIVSGQGQSEPVAHRIAAMLAAAGTPALAVGPAAATPTAIPTAADACLLLPDLATDGASELAGLVARARRLPIPLVAIGPRRRGALMEAADLRLVLPRPGAPGLASMALALGDALAVALAQARGGDAGSGAVRAGGRLGGRLVTVDRIMRGADTLPLVAPDAPMEGTLRVMAAGGLGAAGVVEGGRLVGIVTDADLRRHLDGLMGKAAGEVASRAPLTAPPGLAAAEALRRMGEREAQILFVVDGEGAPLGVVRLHDCLRAGMESERADDRG